MTNEAQLRVKVNNPFPMVCVDATAYEKGALAKLSGPALLIAVPSVLGDPCAGIIAREKIASDGRTQVSLYRDGWFDMYVSGTAVAGLPACLAAHGNYVAPATQAMSGAQIIGTFLEAGTTGTQVLVDVHVGASK